MNKNELSQGIIYKSNELVESSYRLNTSQNRLLYLAMSKLKNIILDKDMNIQQVEDAINKANFQLITIPVTEYKKVFNLKNNNAYTELAKIASELYEEDIIYMTQKGNIVRKRWVITCAYDDDNKSVALQFHPDLIRDLLIFKSKFTKLIFDDFANKLKNKYSFRIYELCKQYLSFGKRDFDLQDFRFKLGVKDSEYEKYSVFKKWVINAALKEINQYTDMDIECEEIERIKRKVTKIRFKMKLKNAKQVSLFEPQPQEYSIAKIEADRNIVIKLSQMTMQDLTAGQSELILMTALKVIDDNNLDIGVEKYIAEKVEICKHYIKHNTTPINNYVGLLLKSIKENWKNNEIITNKFCDYEQREYDYDLLEKQLLGWE